jgi:SAM-dependent methyltransferase
MIQQERALEYFFTLSTQLLEEARQSHNDQLINDLHQFLEMYCGQPQSLPRTDLELFRAQQLLRRLLIAQRCYQLVYEWYPCFKYPLGEDLEKNIQMYIDHVRASFDSHSWMRGYDSVLECGCGVASIGLAVAKYNRLWIAADISRPEALDGLIRLFKPGDTFRICQMDAARLDSIADESLGAIISRSFFEHLLIDDAIAHITNAYRALKLGGDFIIECPANVGPPSDITNRFPDYDVAQGLHIKEWRVSELTQELRKAGFGFVRSRFVRIRGMGAIPLALQRNDFLPSSIATILEMLAGHTWRSMRRTALSRTLWRQIWGHLGASSTFLVARKV